MKTTDSIPRMISKLSRRRTRAVCRLARLAPVLSFLLLSGGAARPADRIVYVSPGGSDAWSGAIPAANSQRNDGPVATPRHARDLARAIRAKHPAEAGPITISLRGGDYFLDETLTLSPADSGTLEQPAIWTAYPNEHPTLSGGRPLSGWTRGSLNGRQVWTSRLPADGPAIVRELWLGDRRLTRCRLPKHGTFGVAGMSDNQQHPDFTQGVNQFRYAPHDLKAWPTAADGEAIVTTRWAESHLPITAIDEKAHVIHFSKRSVFALDPDDRYWIENVRECLTEPGEFYVDPRERLVYLIPPAGIDPRDVQIIAPRLSQIVRLAGDPAAGRFVEHLVLRGLGFSHTAWNFDGPISGQQGTTGKGTEWSFEPSSTRSGFHQAAIGVPGAIAGSGVRFCQVENCRIAHVGTYGVELGEGCQKNRISHSEFTDLGAGGVKIGEVVVRQAANEQTSGNEVSDCTIADGGNQFPSCVGLWIGQSHDNLIAHNDIHGLWYTGISIGWTWGYGPSAAQHNVVEYNHVHHIGVKADGETPILSDMGAIYTLGNQEGSLIRFNRFHDIGALRYGGWGIYFDEGTTHQTAENNLVYRTTHGGLHQHYGQENIVRNNIFAFGRDAQIQRTRIENHQSFTFIQNIVLWNRGSLLAGDWHELNVAFDHNTYWHDPPKDIRFAQFTWDQWRKAGVDRNSKIADPHFANAVGDDFRLTAQSSGALAGFQPFDISQVGPRSK